ncbi:MAG: GIY-YIG nuclease family protein [Candidatus Gracilibacteria bacterium]
MIPQVYILKCSDNSFYTGSTNDIKKRLHEHNNLKSGAHYTKIRRPVEIIYTEIFETLNEARKRECEIKKLTRKEKEKLIEKSINYILKLN